MSFNEFKVKMSRLGVFSIHQVKSWKPDFDNDNLTRWCSKGYLIKLRNGYYVFPENKDIAGFSLYIANRIYSPSYISLNYALNIYGLIPEIISTITSVSSLKTREFSNYFGRFSYQTIQPKLMFGYQEKPFSDRVIYFATMEKAMLDFFYLYPFYNTEKEIAGLRFDENILNNILNVKTLNLYLEKFQNRNLLKRINLLIKLYRL